MAHVFVDTLFNHPLPHDPLRRQQARLALMLLYVLTSLSVFFITMQVTRLLVDEGMTDKDMFILLQNALALGGAVAGIVLIWRGQSDAAIWLIMGTLLLMGVRSMAIFGPADTPTILTFLLPIVFALLLVKRRSLYGVLLAVLAMLFAGLVIANASLSREVASFFALLTLLTIVFDQITISYRQIIDQLRLNTLELESSNHALQREIKRRERAERIEERLVRVLENTSDYVMIVDRHRKLLYINEAGRALAGIDADATLSNLPGSFFFPKWALDLLGQPPDDHFKQGIYHGESFIAPIEGVEVPVSQVILAHLDAQGQIDQLSTVCRDMLDRQFAEQAQFNIALQIERTTALQQMVRRFSHDLRGPLAAIMMGLYLVEKQSDNMESQHKRLGNIREQTQLIQDLIQDTLVYSQLKATTYIQPQPVYLIPLVEQVKRDKLPCAAEKKVRLAFEIPHDDDMWVAGDPTMLKRLVDQLVDNGIKYTPQGGQVLVRIQTEDGYIAFDVVDTGIGIEEAELSRIFEQFYRGSNAKESSILGTGVGLAIAHEVVALHKGQINVTSTLNHGSTFTVRLPLATIRIVK